MSHSPRPDAAPAATSPLAIALAARFGALPQVAAVTLAGSRASGVADARSDLDLYVYADADVPVADRTGIVGDRAERLELDQRFWKLGDTWVDAATGLAVDVMYRSPDWIEGRLDDLLIHHQASVGYSTCLWHNVLASRPLYDRDGWFATLRARADRPYPEPLRRAIVAKNHPILRDASFSYLHQIELALARDDAVSVSHRVAALLASFFDVLFAVNRLPHPGEKRLVEFALARCAHRPADLAGRVHAVLGVPPAATGPDGRRLIAACHALIDDPDALLAADGLS